MIEFLPCPFQTFRARFNRPSLPSPFVSIPAFFSIFLSSSSVRWTVVLIRKMGIEGTDGIHVPRIRLFQGLIIVFPQTLHNLTKVIIMIIEP